jgi:hypothetical protein
MADPMDKTHPQCEAVETCARLAYAVGALTVTYVAGRYAVGLDLESAKEVATLNAGVAYYTHQAAGRIVAALNAGFKKVSRRS